MTSYKTFEEVCNYFNRLENLKIYADSHEYHDQLEDREGDPDNFEGGDCPIRQQQWGFIYHSHHKLLGLLENLEEISFIQIVQEAYKEEFEMIEIFRGEARSEWLVITPNLNENDVMRDWCLDYAYANGFIILETIPQNVVLDIQQKVQP
jgi:hypothetical protein